MKSIHSNISSESLKGLLKTAGLLSNSMLPGKLLSVFQRLDQNVCSNEIDKGRACKIF